jgi:hypothetical protein
VLLQHVGDAYQHWLGLGAEVGLCSPSAVAIAPLLPRVRWPPT